MTNVDFCHYHLISSETNPKYKYTFGIDVPIIGANYRIHSALLHGKIFE